MRPKQTRSGREGGANGARAQASGPRKGISGRGGARRDSRSSIGTRTRDGATSRTRDGIDTSRSGADAGPLVGDVVSALNTIAPFALAAEWDNVGLLAGRAEWPARRALLAIDLTDDVAREALAGGVGVLVVYHPPIFKGVRAVTPAAEGPTSLLPDLLAARVSIIALHTALDAAVGGTNDVLLDVFRPVAREPLEPIHRGGHEYKLVVFVPPAEVDRLRAALAAAGAGVIGHYSECSFALAGRGTFRGDETTHPTIGTRQVLEQVEELRLEMMVPRGRLGEVVRALYASHSYEEPAFDLYPLDALVGRGVVGMGRIGRLGRPQPGARLAERLARRVDFSTAVVLGDLGRRFTSVTVAAGSFGVRGFRDPDSLVITGEFKHHDALELGRRGITAIQLGHYASERPALDRVLTSLGKALPQLERRIARADRAPLRPVGIRASRVSR